MMGAEVIVLCESARLDPICPASTNMTVNPLHRPRFLLVPGAIALAMAASAMAADEQPLVLGPEVQAALAPQLAAARGARPLAV